MYIAHSVYLIINFSNNRYIILIHFLLDIVGNIYAFLQTFAFNFTCPSREFLFIYFKHVLSNDFHVSLFWKRQHKANEIEIFRGSFATPCVVVWKLLFVDPMYKFSIYTTKIYWIIYIYIYTYLICQYRYSARYYKFPKPFWKIMYFSTNNLRNTIIVQVVFLIMMKKRYTVKLGQTMRLILCLNDFKVLSQIGKNNVKKKQSKGLELLM